MNLLVDNAAIGVVLAPYRPLISVIVDDRCFGVERPKVAKPGPTRISIVLVSSSINTIAGSTIWSLQLRQSYCSTGALVSTYIAAIRKSGNPDANLASRTSSHCRIPSYRHPFG
jgi:hypothetical protein